MMTATAPYFAETSRREDLRKELLRWQGTRFWPKSGGRARAQVGADCVSFVEAVLVNVGAITPVKWPRYVVTNGGPEMRDVMLQVLDSIPEMGRIWWKETATDWRQVELMPGDVLVRSIKDNAHHMAIYYGDKTLWHSLARYGVCQASVADAFGIQDMQVIYRAYDRP